MRPRCIDAWLRLQSLRSCPQCKAKCDPARIVNLYVKRLVATDVDAIEALSKRVEEVTLRAQRDAQTSASLRVAYNAALAENRMLRSQLEASYSALKSRATFDAFTLASIAHVASIALPPSFAASSFDYDGHLGVYGVGGSFGAPTSTSAAGVQSHGISIVSSWDYQYVQEMRCHSDLIKAVACDPIPRIEGRILSTGLDRTLRLSSLHSKTELLSIDIESHGWSCAFGSSSGAMPHQANESAEAQDENVILAGCGNGSVRLYDIRSPRRPVQILYMPSATGESFPIHSISMAAPLDTLEDDPSGGKEGHGGILFAANWRGPMKAALRSDLGLEEAPCHYLCRDASGSPTSLGGQLGPISLARSSSYSWIGAIRGASQRHLFGRFDGTSWSDAVILPGGGPPLDGAFQRSFLRPSLLPLGTGGGGGGGTLLVYPDGGSREGASARATILSDLDTVIESSLLAIRPRLGCGIEGARRADGSIIATCINRLEGNIGSDSCEGAGSDLVRRPVACDNPRVVIGLLSRGQVDLFSS